MKKRWICSAEGKSQKTDNDLLGTRVKVTRCDEACRLPCGNAMTTLQGIGQC